MGSKFIKIGIVFIFLAIMFIGFKNKEEIMEIITTGELLDRIIPNSVDSEYDRINDEYTKYEKDVEVFYSSLDYYYDNFIRKNRAMTTYLSEVETDLKRLERIILRTSKKCAKKSNDVCYKIDEKIKGVVDTYNKIVVDYNLVLDSFNEFAKSNFREEHVVSNYKSILSDELLDIYDKIKTNQNFD